MARRFRLVSETSSRNHRFCGVSSKGRYDARCGVGMGGSSLCVEVLRDTFGKKDSYPELLVLDQQHPDQILDIERACDLSKTLFIAASKSGTTLEPECYLEYFWNKLEKQNEVRGSRFAAITDPGTPLETLGEERGFRHVFSNPPEYWRALLCAFVFWYGCGAGRDRYRKIVSRASSEAGIARSEEERNVPLAFGIFLGQNALRGRDKLTIVTPPELRSFGIGPNNCSLKARASWVKEFFLSKGKAHKRCWKNPNTGCMRILRLIGAANGCVIFQPSLLFTRYSGFAPCTVISAMASGSSFHICKGRYDNDGRSRSSCMSFLTVKTGP